MEPIEIIMRLNGRITPVGESNEDSKRLENAKSLLSIYQELTTELIAVSKYANYQQASIKAIGQLIKNGLSEVKDKLINGG